MAYAVQPSPSTSLPSSQSSSSPMTPSGHVGAGTLVVPAESSVLAGPSPLLVVSASPRVPVSATSSLASVWSDDPSSSSSLEGSFDVPSLGPSSSLGASSSDGGAVGPSTVSSSDPDSGAVVSPPSSPP